MPPLRSLLLVESPTKAKKLAAILGPDWVVRASFGHVADLPAKDYGVDLDTLEERYVVRDPERLAPLRAAVASGGFSRVLLASDPDREGEAIAWHLARQLALGGRALRDPIRVEFRELTAGAIRTAVARPRPIDLARVDAQRARRVLDRIVGFDCSKEICWPAGAQSAGRCQTPALHLLCEREREILAFVPRAYWTLEARYAEGLTAFVPAERAEATEHADAAGTAGAPDDGDAEGGDGADPAARRGRLVPRQFATREEAEAVLATARAHAHVVREVEGRRTERRPPPPYTTSTLQQDASRKLRLSAKATMDAAQALFEAGAITYHRTDSPRVADEAAAMARDWLARHHPDTLPATPPRARSAAGAQDAHEAIRPTRLDQEEIPAGAAATLYAMIRARFLASQARPARIDRTTVWIDAGPVAWVAEGAVVVERGFLEFWGPYVKQEDVVLPTVTPGQTLGVETLRTHERTTSPPPRYDQGALIKKLETSGIGRPATFASIIETLLRRDYVREVAAPTARGKRVLQPTEFGLQVDGLMTHAFAALVSEGYTADMEARLDAIEQGEATRPAYLRAWYDDFRGAMARARTLGADYRATHGLRARSGASGGEETSVRCDRCGEATYRKVARRGGKGSFLVCPSCRMMRDVRAKVRPGGCPACGAALIVKKIGNAAPFWGCVRYGAPERPCTHREPVRDDAGGAAPTRAKGRGVGVGAAATAGAAAGATAGAAAGVPRATRSRARGGATTRGADGDAPRARRTRRVPAAAVRYTRAPSGRTCPRCSREELATLTPVADPREPALFACEDERCGFTLPVGARRRREPCPRCGAMVLERRDADAGGASVWRCARSPECDHTVPMADRAMA